MKQYLLITLALGCNSLFGMDLKEAANKKEKPTEEALYAQKNLAKLFSMAGKEKYAKAMKALSGKPEDQLTEKEKAEFTKEEKEKLARMLTTVEVLKKVNTQPAFPSEK
jgi:hypothetical protein